MLFLSTDLPKLSRIVRLNSGRFEEYYRDPHGNAQFFCEVTSGVPKAEYSEALGQTKKAGHLVASRRYDLCLSIRVKLLHGRISLMQKE
jgi:hypothetical protein